MHPLPFNSMIASRVIVIQPIMDNYKISGDHRDCNFVQQYEEELNEIGTLLTQANDTLNATLHRVDIMVDHLHRIKGDHPHRVKEAVEVAQVMLDLRRADVKLEESSNDNSENINNNNKENVIEMPEMPPISSIDKASEEFCVGMKYILQSSINNIECCNNGGVTDIAGFCRSLISLGQEWSRQIDKSALEYVQHIKNSDQLSVYVKASNDIVNKLMNVCTKLAKNKKIHYKFNNNISSHVFNYFFTVFAGVCSYDVIKDLITRLCIKTKCPPEFYLWSDY